MVIVSDDGRGFDPARGKPGRNGLSNMARRMQEVGGRFLITSEAGKGCRVEFRLPVPQARSRVWNWIWKPTGFPERVTEAKPL